MSKSRGGKSAHSRAGHKSKNKKTYRGRFQPLLTKKEIELYVDVPKRKDTTDWRPTVKDVFNTPQQQEFCGCNPSYPDPG